jgi:thiamine monophosphate kinase
LVFDRKVHHLAATHDVEVEAFAHPFFEISNTSKMKYVGGTVTPKDILDFRFVVVGLIAFREAVGDDGNFAVVDPDDLVVSLGEFARNELREASGYSCYKCDF